MTYDTVLYELLEAMADELARVDFQAELLHREKNTLTTEALIARHEDDFGLPSDFISIPSTYSERRATINALLKAYGRMDKAYYVGLASDLNHTVSIIEFVPCICGVAICGDNNVGDQAIFFYWGAVVYYNHSMVTPADDYEIPNFQNLINMYDYYKPAHTIVLWGFYGPPFSNGFGFGFDSEPPNAVSSTWDGSFDYDGFSSGFDRDYGYDTPSYLGGGFTLGFNNGFKLYRKFDPTVYFGGGFDLGFSTGFDTNYNIRTDL
jgi:uncharacterized protein YmfQ (DUF2313 family)